MSQAKPLTMRDYAILELTKARDYQLTAISDLNRANRVDALDAIALARKAISKGNREIRETYRSAL